MKSPKFVTPTIQQPCTRSAICSDSNTLFRVRLKYGDNGNHVVLQKCCDLGLELLSWKDGKEITHKIFQKGPIVLGVARKVRIYLQTCYAIQSASVSSIFGKTSIKGCPAHGREYYPNEECSQDIIKGNQRGHLYQYNRDSQKRRSQICQLAGCQETEKVTR